MTAIHHPRYGTPTAAKAEPEIIAAFASADSARRVVEDLQEIGVEADIIVSPLSVARDALDPFESGTNRTITGAMLGAIWGMLLAALMINFVAVNPSLLTTLGLIVFGSIGGMAVGGFIAGGYSTPKIRRSDWAKDGPDLGPPEAEAFVTVHSQPAAIDSACRIVEAGHPMNIYRA